MGGLSVQIRLSRLACVAGSARQCASDVRPTPPDANRDGMLTRHNAAIAQVQVSTPTNVLS
jgi:hypothetical protein